MYDTVIARETANRRQKPGNSLSVSFGISPTYNEIPIENAIENVTF